MMKWIMRAVFQGEKSTANVRYLNVENDEQSVGLRWVETTPNEATRLGVPLAVFAGGHSYRLQALHPHGEDNWVDVKPTSITV